MGRNIVRSTKTLCSNVEEILALYAKLPGTKHDLTSADKFSLDAWLLDGGCVNGEAALFINLHGQFAEGMEETPGRVMALIGFAFHLVANGGVRSFDRSFVLASAPVGSTFVILWLL
jgi:nuclear RNA export factor